MRLKNLRRGDVLELVANAAFKEFVSSVAEEVRVLVDELAHADMPDKERHEKRGRLLALEEILRLVGELPYVGIEIAKTRR